MTSRAQRLDASGLAGWVRAIGSGAMDGGHELAAALTHAVGPVWVPMLAIAVRVGWVGARALRSRFGAPAAPVRPELGHLAPLFAALGLCGTVWGLSSSFDALGGGGFLGQVPALLGGLGAAMTSTLLGLGLQIATLLLAAFNPAWSVAEIQWSAGQPSVALDGRELGAGDVGIDALVEAIAQRQPEALRVRFDARVPEADRARVRASLWRSVDGAIRVRCP